MAPDQHADSYDPITWIQHLQWKLKCYESSPTEFQRTFEEVALRVRPDFMRVKPYGRLGDRKCDGLYWGDGTVFQVYSPDFVKQADTIRKIEEDLAGAIEEWGESLRKWVFVYNTRYGLAPFVPSILTEQQRKHSAISVEPLSSERLWQLMLDELSVQQRSEVLGPPAGYEHLYLLPGTIPEEVEAQIRDGRFVVIQDILSPINIDDAVKALIPERPAGPPIFVHPPTPEESWEFAAQYQEEAVSSALNKSEHLLPRFAVFSLAPIPLAIHLGYLLSDRVEVRPFQFDRDRSTWSWPATEEGIESPDVRIDGLPEVQIDDLVDAVVRVSISASITPEDTDAVAGKCPVQVDLSVDRPNVNWLSSPGQLTALRRAFRETIATIRSSAPRCNRIHVFYAGPTGGAVAIGQSINPRMNPEIALYEYDRRKQPRYEQVLTLR